MPRQNNYDFLRLFFACLVIYSHGFALVDGVDSEPFLAGVSLGSLAVDGFFAISGCFIAISWLRSRTAVDYFRKRVYRIYPGFIVASLLCLFVVLPIASAESWSIERSAPVKLALLMFPDTSPTFAGQESPALNGSLWTIKYEFMCYCGLAVLGLVGMLRRRFILPMFVASLAVSFCFVAFNLAEHTRRFDNPLGAADQWARLSSFFLAGMAFALCKHRMPMNGLLAASAALLAIVGGSIPYAHTILLPTAFVYLVFWFGDHGWRGLNNVGKFGDFSYGTYLYAFPIQQLCVMWLGDSATPLIVFAISLPLSLVAGVLSFHLVEKPFMRLAHKSRAVASTQHSQAEPALVRS